MLTEIIRSLNRRPIHVAFNKGNQIVQVFDKYQRWWNCRLLDYLLYSVASLILEDLFALYIDLLNSGTNIFVVFIVKALIEYIKKLDVLRKSCNDHI